MFSRIGCRRSSSQLAAHLFFLTHLFPLSGPVTREQVESMGATFLEVDYQEDGSGSGGYAKEMSDEVSFSVEFRLHFPARSFICSYFSQFIQSYSSKLPKLS